MSWPLSIPPPPPPPRSICKHGEKSRSNNKSQLRNNLQKISPSKPQKEDPDIAVCIVGCDFTYPFYTRAKFQVFTLMMNLKKAKQRVVSVYLLDTLGTENPDYDKIIDFIVRTVHNRPANDETPKDSRLAMLFGGKGKSRKFRSTKTLPPDRRSLLMKIKRASTIVSYSLSMDPCDWGSEVRDNLLIPVWFGGSNLPSNTEYDLHIKNTLQNYEDTDSDISDSESEDDSDEFSASETYSSSDEDDDIGCDNDF